MTHNYGDVTGALWHLRSLAARFRMKLKETPRIRITGPCLIKSTGDRWFPLQMVNYVFPSYFVIISQIVPQFNISVKKEDFSTISCYIGNWKNSCLPSILLDENTYPCLGYLLYGVKVPKYHLCITDKKFDSEWNRWLICINVLLFKNNYSSVTENHVCLKKLIS